MRNWFLALLLALSWALPGFAEVEGRRVEVKKFSQQNVGTGGTTHTFRRISLSDTEVHAVFWNFTTDGTNIDATIQAEVGFIDAGAVVWFTPADASTTIDVTSVTNSDSGSQVLSLPVAQLIRLKVTNDDLDDPLDVDRLLLAVQ